ncbi:MAG: hypothetical protein ABIQ95_08285 [Bdellovibrionia bacterium]
MKFNNRVGLLLLMVCFRGAALAGEVGICSNGSSGVGNGLLMDYGLCAELLPGTIRIESGHEGQHILDGKNGEKLLLLRTVKQSEMGKYNGHLMPAQLGQALGFQYLPDLNGKSKVPFNFWIICKPSRTDCLIIKPISFTNSKVNTVMGALRLVDNVISP